MLVPRRVVLYFIFFLNVKSLNRETCWKILETHCKHHRWKEPSMFASWQLMDWGGNADHYLEHFALISILFTLLSDGFLILKIPGIEGCGFARLLGTHTPSISLAIAFIFVSHHSLPQHSLLPHTVFVSNWFCWFSIQHLPLMHAESSPETSTTSGLRPRWIRATTGGEILVLGIPSPFQGKRLAESQIRTNQNDKIGYQTKIVMNRYIWSHYTLKVHFQMIGLCMGEVRCCTRRRTRVADPVLMPQFDGS